MARNAFFAVLSLVLGCGPPFSERMRCFVRGGDATIVVHLEGARGCGYYEEAIADAMTDIQSSGFSTTTAFVDLHLWVWDDPDTISCNGTESWGCYHPGMRVIEVNRSAASLLHEMLHHVERAPHGPDGHRQWDTRGAALGAPAVQVAPTTFALKGSWLHIANLYEWRWAKRDKGAGDENRP